MKFSVKDKFVGKRCVDSETEENGIEPKQKDIKKGGKKLYAYARIMVEHDDSEFLQSNGTEFKLVSLYIGNPILSPRGGESKLNAIRYTWRHTDP